MTVIGRSAARAVEQSVGSLRAGWWALRASWVVRGRLVRSGLGRVRLPPAPRLKGQAGSSAARAVNAVCSRRGLTCLESALVRRAWLGRQGQPCEIVIGVTAPSSGFVAHAWLETDPIEPAFAELSTLRSAGQRKDLG